MKKGSEPHYLFVNAEVVSQILAGNGIPAKHPQHAFYKDYILDKLKGTWFATSEEGEEAILSCIPKVTSLSFREGMLRFGQEDEPDVPEPEVTKQELRNLYKQEVRGIYDEEAMDFIISDFIRVLEEWIVLGKWSLKYEYENEEDKKSKIYKLEVEQLEDEKKLLQILQRAKTPQEKMIAIDQVINTAHLSGVYGSFLIKDIELEGDSFYDELSNLKISSLNMRKKAQPETPQENFYEPGKSDEYPKGPKKPKRRFPFYNYPPDDQGNIINADPSYSNPMEYDTLPGAPPQGPGIFGKLNMRKKYAQLVTKQELLRLYKQEAKGIYDEELEDEIISGFIVGLEEWKQGLYEASDEGDSWFEERISIIDELIDILQQAKTPQEKMIAIDRVINTIHSKGPYINYLVEGGDEAFLEQLGSLYTPPDIESEASLNMRKKADEAEERGISYILKELAMQGEIVDPIDIEYFVNDIASHPPGFAISPNIHAVNSLILNNMERFTKKFIEGWEIYFAEEYGLKESFSKELATQILGEVLGEYYKGEVREEAKPAGQEEKWKPLPEFIKKRPELIEETMEASPYANLLRKYSPDEIFDIAAGRKTDVIEEEVEQAKDVITRGIVANRLSMRKKGKGLKEYIREKIEEQFIIPQQLKLRFDKVAQAEFNIGDEITFDTTRYLGRGKKRVGGVLKGKGVITKKEDDTYSVEIIELTEVARDLKNIFRTGITAEFTLNEIKLEKPKIEPEKEIPVEEPKLKEKIPAFEVEKEPSKLPFEFEEEEAPTYELVEGLEKPTEKPKEEKEKEEKPFWKELVEKAWESLQRPVTKPFGSNLYMKKTASFDEHEYKWKEIHQGKVPTYTFEGFQEGLQGEKYILVDCNICQSTLMLTAKEVKAYEYKIEGLPRRWEQEVKLASLKRVQLLPQEKDFINNFVKQFERVHDAEYIYSQLQDETFLLHLSLHLEDLGVSKKRSDPLAIEIYKQLITDYQFFTSPSFDLLDSTEKEARLNMRKKAVVSADELKRVYTLEPLYRELEQKYNVGALTEEESIQFLQTEKELDELTDKVVRDLMFFFEDYLRWYKKHPGSIREEEGEAEVIKNMEIRWRELNNAFDINEKMIVIDNVINMMHVNFPIIAHLSLEHEEYLDREEPEGISMDKMIEIEEAWGNLVKFLEEQGKLEALPKISAKKHRGPVKSILEDIAQDVWTATDLETAKNVIINKVENSKIDEDDKRTIIDNTNKSSTLLELQKYIANSILFYEGMGTKLSMRKKAVSDSRVIDKVTSYFKANDLPKTYESVYAFILEHYLELSTWEMERLTEKIVNTTRKQSMRKKAEVVVEGSPPGEGSWAMYQGNVYVTYDKNKRHAIWFEELRLPSAGVEYDNIVRGYFVDDRNYIGWYGTGDYNEFYDHLGELKTALGYSEDSEVGMIDYTQELQVLSMRKKATIPVPLRMPLDYPHSWPQKKKKKKEEKEALKTEADLKSSILSLLLVGATIPGIADMIGVPQKQVEQTIQSYPEYFEEVEQPELAPLPEYVVTATIYHAIPEQTSADPEFTADMTRIDPDNVPTAEGERIIALSRDLLKKFTPDAPFDYGDRILVEGAGEMDGLWVIHDTMNARFSNTIDFLVPKDITTGKWENVKINKVQQVEAVLNMRKKTYVQKVILWAVYKDQAYVKKVTSTTGEHWKWFEEIGLPSAGAEYDKIARGFYDPNEEDMVWYEGTGDFNELYTHLPELIEKLGAPESMLYEYKMKTASNVSVPTPSDSLHEQQGEQNSWHTYFQGKDRWISREPDQGFDIDFPSKERIKRSPWPFDDTTPTSPMMASLSMRKTAQVKAFYVTRLYELEYKMSRLEQKEELTDSENVYYLKMKNEINSLLDYTFQKIYKGLKTSECPECSWDDPSTPSRMRALTRKMKKVENKPIKERIVVLQEVISSAHDIDYLWEWVIMSPGEDELAKVFESDPEILAKWDEELKKLQLSSEYGKYKKEKEVEQEDILDYCRDQINKVLGQDFENWKNKVAEEWSDDYIAHDLGYAPEDILDKQEKDTNEFFDLLQLPDKEKYKKYYKEVFYKIVDENVDYWSEYQRKKRETLNGAVVRATQLVDQGYNNEEAFSIILEEFNVKEKDFANSIWIAMNSARMTLPRNLLASKLSMRKKAQVSLETLKQFYTDMGTEQYNEKRLQYILDEWSKVIEKGKFKKSFRDNILGILGGPGESNYQLSMKIDQVIDVLHGIFEDFSEYRYAFVSGNEEEIDNWFDSPASRGKEASILSMKKKAVITSDMLHNFYKLELQYREEQDLIIEKRLDKLSEQIVKDLLILLNELLDIKPQGSSTQPEVEENLKLRKQELENAFDINSKMIAIDNTINTMHYDWPMIKHLKYQHEEEVEKELGFEVKEDPLERIVFNESWDNLIKFLKEQGKITQEASILDYPQKHLDSAMWDLSGDLPKLKENVKGLIVERFLNYLREEGKLNNPELWCTGFYYTGSTATYRYRPTTDIDIHVKVDWEKFKKSNPDKAKDDIEEMHKELLQVFWNTLNKEVLLDTQHPLTYYVLSERENVFEMGEEAYDILNDSWIVPPHKLPENLDIDEKIELLGTQANAIMERLDEELGKTKRDFIDYKILKELLDSYKGDKKDIQKLIEKKLDDVESRLKGLQEENVKIHDERQKAFHDGQEPIEEGLSQNWAPGNIIFKLIEKYRYMDVLRKIKHIIEDDKITEDEEKQLEDILEPKLSMRKKSDSWEEEDEELEAPEGWWKELGKEGWEYSLVPQHKIRNLYKQEVKGIYDEELLDDIVSSFLFTLKNFYNWLEGDKGIDTQSSNVRKMVTTLEQARTPQEKMIAIDTILSTMHYAGRYADYLIEGTIEDIYSLLDELAKKANSLSMRKTAISDMEVPENWMVQDKTDKKPRRTNPPRHDKNDSLVEHNIDPKIDMASLNMRKRAQTVTKQELKKLYIQEAKGIYDEELMDEIISGFIVTIEQLQTESDKSIKELRDEGIGKEDMERQEQLAREEFGRLEDMFDVLYGAYTPQEKMLAIDTVINIFHEMGKYIEYLVVDGDEAFLEELGNLKISSLNMRKAFYGQPTDKNYNSPSLLLREDMGPSYPSEPAQAEIPGTTDDDSWGESNKLKKNRPTKEKIFPDFQTTYKWPGGEVGQY